MVLCDYLCHYVCSVTISLQHPLSVFSAWQPMSLFSIHSALVALEEAMTSAFARSLPAVYSAVSRACSQCCPLRPLEQIGPESLGPHLCHSGASALSGALSSVLLSPQCLSVSECVSGVSVCLWCLNISGV